MKTHFGPWTTAIDSGSTAQLSAFWKRRLKMLPQVGTGPRRFSWRTRLMLVLLAAAALALPNFSTQTAAQAVASDKAEAKVPEKVTSPAAEYYPPPSEAEKKIEAALNTRMTVEFNETPLAEALELLHKRTGVNLFLDKKTLAKEGIKDGEKMLLRAKDIPLRHVLRFALSQANLVFIVVDDVVMVTTRTEADARLLARTYPVADLIHTAMGPDFASIIEMLSTTVDPTSWDENGGGATAQPNFDSKCLVISQTYANHEQILSLLRSLRAAKVKQQANAPADRQAANVFKIRLEAAADGKLANIRIGDRTIKSIADLETELRARAAGKNGFEPIADDAVIEIEWEPRLNGSVLEEAVKAIQNAAKPKQIMIRLKALTE